MNASASLPVWRNKARSVRVVRAAKREARPALRKRAPTRVSKAANRNRKAKKVAVALLYHHLLACLFHRVFISTRLRCLGSAPGYLLSSAARSSFDVVARTGNSSQKGGNQGKGGAASRPVSDEDDDDDDEEDGADDDMEEVPAANSDSDEEENNVRDFEKRRRVATAWAAPTKQEVRNPLASVFV